MFSTLLQLVFLGAALAVATAASVPAVTVTTADAKGAQPRGDNEPSARRGAVGDLKTDESGRLFDLGLGTVYSGSGTRYQPDAGSYGTYGSYQPGYAGQGVSGLSGYGLYGGYGGFSTLNGLQPCYSGFGAAGSGFGAAGSGYDGFRPSYSPVGPSYYPTTAYPGTYSSSYPSSLGGLGTDYRGYKGYGGYSNSYAPYSTRYGA